MASAAGSPSNEAEISAWAVSHVTGILQFTFGQPSGEALPCVMDAALDRPFGYAENLRGLAVAQTEDLDSEQSLAQSNGKTVHCGA